MTAPVDWANRWEGFGFDDPDPVPALTPSANGGSPEVDTPEVDTSWRPIDLGPYVRGEVRRPEPTVGMVRSDGLRLLYPGKEHAVIGEMESGKSWFCLACTAAEVTQGNFVVYIHFEESDPTDTVERLLALGVRGDDICKYLRFVGPERVVTAGALAALLDPAPTLAVIDGVNEGMALHRHKIREEDGAAAFRRAIVRPFTRVGAAALAADHVTKDPETRGRGPIGSVHKGNALNGALFLMENADTFGRSLRGRSHVYVTKDRPGFLRRRGNPTKVIGKTFVGELVVDDTQSHLGMPPDLKLWAPRNPETVLPTDEAAEDDERVLATVTKLLTEGKPANKRNVRAAAGMRGALVDDALTRLVLADRILEAPGARNARIFLIPGGEQP